MLHSQVAKINSEYSWEVPAARSSPSCTCLWIELVVLTVMVVKGDHVCGSSGILLIPFMRGVAAVRSFPSCTCLWIELVVLTIMVTKGDHVCVAVLGILLMPFMRGVAAVRSSPSCTCLWIELVVLTIMVTKGDHVCVAVLGILLMPFMRSCSCQVLPSFYLSMNSVDCLDFNCCQGWPSLWASLGIH